MSATHSDPVKRIGPFLEYLDIHLLRAANGKAEVQMTVADKHLRSLDMMHGGVTATLLDTCMAWRPTRSPRMTTIP
jgi:uncharacterized protein (TIGR00369 family)